MIPENSAIKHEKAMDVCFYVQEIKVKADGGLFVKGRWTNLGFQNSWFIENEIRRIHIQPEDVSKWYFVTEPGQYKCLRHAPWEKLK